MMHPHDLVHPLRPTAAILQTPIIRFRSNQNLMTPTVPPCPYQRWGPTQPRPQWGRPHPHQGASSSIWSGMRHTSAIWHWRGRASPPRPPGLCLAAHLPSHRPWKNPRHQPPRRQAPQRRPLALVDPRKTRLTLQTTTARMTIVVHRGQTADIVETVGRSQIPQRPVPRIFGALHVTVVTITWHVKY